MANRLDAITQRPIGEWRLSPPEIIVASNGFVLRTYDITSDTFEYTVSLNAEGVRAALVEWGEAVADNIKRAVERELAKA